MSDTTAERVVTTVDELKELIGQEIGVSDWLEITQERVNQFADATGDHQYIHVDPERAAKTFFGGTIAHGYLTLSLIPALSGTRQGVKINLGGKMGVNYGLNKVRFTAPVPVGKRIRSRTTLLAVEEIGDRAVQTTNQVIIEVEGGDKPACIAETLGRTYF
ncbi:MAG TPA: MaoC family dehydratase [Thermomicrobiales bacterium]|nr:MaoC family dehydratase [Thermomicrobiales bacterium]